MKSIIDRLERLEARRVAPLITPPPEMADEVRALVAALPPKVGERDELLRQLLARVDSDSATGADLALLAECSIGTLRIAGRLEASC